MSGGRTPALVWIHAKAQTTELLRYPSFSVPTLAMPAIVFEIVGARTHAPASLAMVSYAAFALLGVAFFQFGVGVAAERTSPWYAYLRILPAPTAARVGGRVLSALAFGLCSAALVAVLAVATDGARLAPARWLALAAGLVAGSIPFALLGVAIGYAVTPKAALPVANLLYLASAYVGGLFGASTGGSGLVGAVRPYVPTHAWLELLAWAVGAASFELRDLVALAALGVAAAAAATIAYRRDEGQRFR
jgi:ABC-2 type transport system permease protein